MDLLACADFSAVATYGGFGQASRATGRPKATLSRRVRALEHSLGVRLIERGARPLRLTEVGAAFHERTSALLVEFAEAGEMVRAASREPRGRLRVSAPIMLADMVLGRIAHSFSRAFPAVSLDITAEDRMANLLADGFDLVIRVDPSPDERLVGRCVLRDERWLVAAPSVAHPADPEHLRLTILPAVMRATPRQGTVWRIKTGDRACRYEPKPVMCLSSLPMLRDAVVNGAGAALLPRSLVGHDVATGSLVLWGIEEGPPPELWALHASRRLVNPAVTTFTRHLADALAGTA